ncbi:MAG TPA: acyl carrier protein [Candidatus Krumholzibacteria bacterium]|nr:acyl carrier protein [Candidatus Krumholzibacteria bacterium]
MESSIRRFIVNNLMMKKDENIISLDDPLLEKGIVDSWGIVELVEFLRKEFSIQVDDSEILPENFQDVKSIAALVRKNQ